MQLDTTEQARAYLVRSILSPVLDPDRIGTPYYRLGGGLMGTMAQALHAARTLRMVGPGALWAYESVLFDKDGECITDPVAMLMGQDGGIA